MTQLVSIVSPVVFTSPFGESDATVISLIFSLLRICESICSYFFFYQNLHVADNLEPKPVIQTDKGQNETQL